MLEEAFLPAVTWLAKPYQIGRHCGSWKIISVNTGGLKYLPGIDAEHNSGNFRFWHKADYEKRDAITFESHQSICMRRQ